MKRNRFAPTGARLGHNALSRYSCLSCQPVLTKFLAELDMRRIVGREAIASVSDQLKSREKNRRKRASQDTRRQREYGLCLV